MIKGVSIKVDIPTKIAKEITEEYLNTLSEAQLDQLFASHINDFFDADRVFKRVRLALQNPSRIT